MNIAGLVTWMQLRAASTERKRKEGVSCKTAASKRSRQQPTRPTDRPHHLYPPMDLAPRNEGGKKEELTHSFSLPIDRPSLRSAQSVSLTSRLLLALAAHNPPPAVLILLLSLRCHPHSHSDEREGEREERAIEPRPSSSFPNSRNQKGERANSGDTITCARKMMMVPRRKERIDAG